MWDLDIQLHGPGDGVLVDQSNFAFNRNFICLLCVFVPNLVPLALFSAEPWL